MLKRAKDKNKIKIVASAMSELKNLKRSCCLLLRQLNERHCSLRGRRITMHLQSGAPLKHSLDFHSSTLNRERMVSNTSIIRQENDFNRLEIMEALYIKYTKPAINLQTTGKERTLLLLGDIELSYATNSHIRHLKPLPHGTTLSAIRATVLLANRPRASTRTETSRY